MTRKARENRSFRDVNGILLLDKPVGMSSNAVLQQVKRFFQANKAGHTGSLDPLASGMLPVCFGYATKFCQYLLDAPKTYEVVMQLGTTTSTGDKEGDILQQKPVEPSLFEGQTVDVMLKKFTGKQQQTPSMYSALKHQGKPLYKFARKGIEIAREPRDITVYRIHLFDSSVTQGTFSLTVSCSKGTYIRTLVEDMGDFLGCGAHVSKLRRTQVSPFKSGQMVSIEKLEAFAEEANFTAMDELLLPPEVSIADWPEVILSKDLSQAICHGQKVRPSKPLNTVGRVKLMSDNNIFLGIGELDSHGVVSPRKLVRASIPSESVTGKAY